MQMVATRNAKTSHFKFCNRSYSDNVTFEAQQRFWSVVGLNGTRRRMGHSSERRTNGAFFIPKKHKLHSA